MKNISTGTGLCVLGLCLASYPIIDRVMPRAEAGATHVAAVVAAATAQVPPEPTVVWYGCVPGYYAPNYNRIYSGAIFRCWSDGRIEGKAFTTGTDYPGQDRCSVGACPNWVLVNDPNSGYTASADINFDSKVDGSDLGQLLASWGDAPRHDVAPSTCPLNLINP